MHRGKTLALLALISVAIIGAFAWNALPHNEQITNNQLPITNTANGQPKVTFLDPIRGDRNAPHTIIEFGDFECSACADAEETLSLFIKTHPDVRLVWKDFPLPVHPFARLAAEAAHCAGDQKKFWEYHDLLMRNQSSFASTPWLDLANQLKLDAAAFSSCLDQQLHANQITASFNEGVNAGVDGVPYFFVNGRTFSGTVSTEELESALNTP